MSRLMIIDPDEMNTKKDPAMKTDINKELNLKIMEILNLKRQDHFAQSIQIKI
jgi:hypothetical protein